MKEQVQCDSLEGTLGLVLGVGKVAGNKIALLQFDPVSRQQTIQDRISAKSELGLQENRVFVCEVVKWDAFSVVQGSKNVEENVLKGWGRDARRRRGEEESCRGIPTC